MANLYRFSVLTLVALFLVLNPGFCSHTQNRSTLGVSVPERAAASLLAIYSLDAEGNIDRHGGAGTYIETQEGPAVITARHVIVYAPADVQLVACYQIASGYSDAERCVLLQRDSNRTRMSETHDVAVVALEDELPAHPARYVEDYGWTVGEPIIVTGTPNRHRCVNAGRITWGRAPSLIVTDTAVWWGSSGGGVWNERGELIGVVASLEIAVHWLLGPKGHVVEGNKRFSLIPEGLL